MQNRLFRYFDFTFHTQKFNLVYLLPIFLYLSASPSWLKISNFRLELIQLACFPSNMDIIHDMLLLNGYSYRFKRYPYFSFMDISISIFVNDILNGHPFMTSFSQSSSLTSQFLLWTSLSPLWTSLTKSGYQYLINGHPIMDIPISLLDITIKLMPFVLHTVMMYYCLVYNPNCIPSSFTIILIIACSMFVLL